MNTQIEKAGLLSFVLPMLRKNLKRIKDKETRDYYSRRLHNCLLTGKEKELAFINNQINMIIDIQKAGIHHEKGN